MKNGLLRFYFVFMIVSLVLFSFESRDQGLNIRATKESLIERKPDNRHPVEPNGAPSEPQKGKKSRGKYISRSSNWC